MCLVRCCYCSKKKIKNKKITIGNEGKWRKRKTKRKREKTMTQLCTWNIVAGVALVLLLLKKKKKSLQKRKPTLTSWYQTAISVFVYLSFFPFCTFVFLFFCLFVFSSRHHYDQMFQGSQVFVQTERKLGERSMTLLKVKCSCNVLTGEKKTWHAHRVWRCSKKTKKEWIETNNFSKGLLWHFKCLNMCNAAKKKGKTLCWVQSLESISTFYLAVNFRTYQNPDLFNWPLIWTFCH